MTRHSQKSDAYAHIQNLRNSTRRYKLALEWLNDNQRACFKRTNGIFSTMTHANAVQYIAKQIKLLENEAEKIRYTVLKSHF
eukprot:jgi/Antlo1/1364/1207